MRAESRLFLVKAQESLASAEADLHAGRFNSAANRAYYATFQGAVAALIEQGVGPRGAAWDHKFVISEFSDRLVRRRKLVAAPLIGVLDSLLTARLSADYRANSIGTKTARRSVKEARGFVTELITILEG